MRFLLRSSISVLAVCSSATTGLASQATLRHTAPKLGSVLEIELGGAAPFAHVALLASPRPGNHSTTWGQLELERAQLTVLATGSTDVNGRWTFQATLPSDPGLAETPMHVQALVDPFGAAPPELSAALHLRWLGSRAYVGRGDAFFPPAGTIPGGLSIVSLAREQLVTTVASTRPSLATRAGGTLCAFSELRPESPLGGYRVATRGMIEVCAPPSSYCTSLPNSSGVIASIGWSGSPSFTTDDWSLTCSGLPPGVPGTFFMGPSALPSGAPFANGLRCVGLPFVRLGMIATNGGSGAQIQHLASSNFFGVSPGDTRYVQFWFRDGQAGGANANLSNALSVTFCP